VLDGTRYSRPWDDNFGEATQTGTWTVYPYTDEQGDGVFWSKVDEVTSDGDATHIQAESDNAYCLLAYEGVDLSLPEYATTIVVKIQARVRNTASGTSYIQGMVRDATTDYLIGTNTSISSTSYALKTWTMNNPPWRSWDEWTVADVYALTTCGVGVKVSDATPNLRITQLYLEVVYEMPLYYFELANNIDASGFAFVPIGQHGEFTGTLDGQGFAVQDLSVIVSGSGVQYGGLFTTIGTNGIVRDLTLTACAVNVTSTGLTSGRVFAGALAAVNKGEISNCHVSGTISGTGPTDTGVNTLAGGMVASQSAGSITGSSANCTVYASHPGLHAYAGGFMSGLSGGSISECFALGNVEVSARYNANGGGFLNQAYLGEISDSYARGNVSATAAEDGTSRAGGFVADAREWCPIQNSYSTGAPSADITGGFCAVSDDADITDSFWDTASSGQATSAGGTGKTTAQMKAISTFSAWDIGLTELAYLNDGYAFLSWQIGNSPTWLINPTFGDINQVVHFQPNTIILGTTLPNRAGGGGV